MPTDTFNDLFMVYVTVMHDAWVDFLFFLVDISCLQIGHPPGSGNYPGVLRCTIHLTFSLGKYLSQENWNNELGFCVNIF